LVDNGYRCESHVKFVKLNQRSTHQQKIYEYKGTETLGVDSQIKPGKILTLK